MEYPDPAPIILFVYNRPVHTSKVLSALIKNTLASESTLYIYADGPKNDQDKILVNQVHDLIKEVKGFKEVIIRSQSKNKGLASSVIDGVSEVVNDAGSVIVLEDDIYTSTDFLTFMNAAISFYKADPKIFSITGYSYPMKIPANYHKHFYYHYRSCSWSWATWADSWNKADWSPENINELFSDTEKIKAFKSRCGSDLIPMTRKYLSGKIDSWAVRWTYTHFLHNALCVYPLNSLVKNIGMDGSGTHFKKRSNYLSTEIGWQPKKYLFDHSMEVNPEIHKSIKKLLNVSTIRKVIDRFIK